MSIHTVIHMSRRKALAKLPEYMVKVGPAFKLKRPIPECAFGSFPELSGKQRIKTISLGNDYSPALKRFVSELEHINAKIEVAKAKSMSKSPSGHIGSGGARFFTSDEIELGFAEWGKNKIAEYRATHAERELAHLNGVDLPFSDVNGLELIAHRLNSIYNVAGALIREMVGRGHRNPLC